MLLLLPLLTLPTLGEHSLPQCCLGAQNQDVTSAGGGYRVVATSLDGTGFDVHGPYRFRFETFRVKDGEDEKLGSFVRTWDTREHFSMTVAVSPTGNGFLLGASFEPDLLLLAPDGTTIRSIVCPSYQTIWPLGESRTPPPPPSPLHVEIHSAGMAQPTGKAQPGATSGSRRTFAWLPLAHVVGPEERWSRAGEPGYRALDPRVPRRWNEFDEPAKAWLLRALTWSPELGGRERDEVTTQVAALRDAPDSRTARAALVELGLSARGALRAAIREQAAGDPLFQLACRELLDELRSRLGGHEEPWRHRELLTALTTHPDPDVRACAEGRLEALGGDGQDGR